MTARIEDGLYTRLSTFAALVNLIGTRVYPVRLPQTATLPALTFQRISSPRVNTHDTSGAAGTAHPRFQFDAWATTKAGAKAVTDQVRAALQGYKGTITVGADTVTVQGSLIADERDNYDGETGLYWVSSDYVIWHGE